MWLLHIEDDVAVQRTLRRSLRVITDLEVVCACSLAAALEAYRARRPHEPLALIADFDLGSSEPDGVAAVAALRRAGLVRPCAFLTSTPEGDVRRRLAAESVTDPITLWPKPDGISGAVEWLTAIAMSRATA